MVAALVLIANGTEEMELYALRAKRLSLQTS